MSLIALIKRLQDIMRRDNGVDGDAQRLSQVVWFLFLKVFDYKEQEGELKDDYKPVIPVGYRWRDWAEGKSAKEQMTGEELVDFVNNRLFPILRGNPVKSSKGETIVPFGSTSDRAMLVKNFMKDSYNYMKKGVELRQVVNLFNEVDLSDSGESHAFNDIYENILRGLQSAGNAGEFYTPRALTNFAVDHVDPSIGEKVADFTSGTGGFLVDALRHMEYKIQAGDVKSQNCLQTAVEGIEWKPLPYMLCTTNLLLHGIEVPNIINGDTFMIKKYSDIVEKDRVNVIVMNPPYGGVSSKADQETFPSDIRTSETADLFVAYIINRLKTRGRAAVVLPDSFLFGTDNAKVAIKKKLLRECSLHTVIRLPPSVFAPYTSIATNILFFDKSGPTFETWFYRMDLPEGYVHFNKTRPITREHMKPVDNWWSSRTEIKDTGGDTYKARKYSIDEIRNNGYNIDLCGYPTKEDEILSPTETMDRFMERRGVLERQMDEKLDAIKKLLEG